MADETGTTAAGASPDAASPVQGTPAASATTPDENPIRDPKAFLAAYERMKADLATTKAKLTEHETAQLSEAEKLAKRAKQLEAELDQERADRRDAINRYEVQLKAASLGIVDPEAAVKLLDWTHLEYDDQGSPKDLEQALQALAKQRPWLVTPAGQATPARTTNPARQTSPGEKVWTQAEIADPVIWAKNRDEITQAMRDGRVV